jgi:hypothetical protein
VTLGNDVLATSAGLAENGHATGQGNSQANGHKRVYPTGPITCFLYMGGWHRVFACESFKAWTKIHGHRAACLNGKGIVSDTAVLVVLLLNVILLDCLIASGQPFSSAAQGSMPFEFFRPSKCAN